LRAFSEKDVEGRDKPGHDSGIKGDLSALQHHDALQKKADSQYSDQNENITIPHGKHAGGNAPWRTI
jgi:hypothetical protein